MENEVLIYLSFELSTEETFVFTTDITELYQLLGDGSVTEQRTSIIP